MLWLFCTDTVSERRTLTCCQCWGGACTQATNLVAFPSSFWTAKLFSTSYNVSVSLPSFLQSSVKHFYPLSKDTWGQVTHNIHSSMMESALFHLSQRLFCVLSVSWEPEGSRRNDDQRSERKRRQHSSVLWSSRQQGCTSQRHRHQHLR